MRVLRSTPRFDLTEHLIYQIKDGVIYINTHEAITKIFTPAYASYRWDDLNKITTNLIFTKVRSGYFFRYFTNTFSKLWLRIIFRGKGFRIRNFKNNRKMTFNFGRSHWTKLKFSHRWFFNKIRRQSYVVTATLIRDVELFTAEFPNVRLVNKYTKRGLRLKRQALVKRFGKISQYVSSLH